MWNWIKNTVRAVMGRVVDAAVSIFRGFGGLLTLPVGGVVAGIGCLVVAPVAASTVAAASGYGLAGRVLAGLAGIGAGACQLVICVIAGVIGGIVSIGTGVIDAGSCLVIGRRLVNTDSRMERAQLMMERLGEVTEFSVEPTYA